MEKGSESRRKDGYFLGQTKISIENNTYPVKTAARPNGWVIDSVL